MESRTLRGGRYTVRNVLGEGAQGVTYEAEDRETGGRVAVKRFDVRGARSWKDVELAEREARVLATLDHPLVPRYIEHFEEDGALYLVMEKIEGETLESIRQREGALPEAEVRRFLACADRALSYLHGRGAPVVHRDIKPRNVVRRPDGTYVLVDFGAVSELLVRRGSSTIVGTLGYMAPEQLQGRAMPATDVYAVGATALAALSFAEPDTLPHEGLRVDVRAATRGRVSDELATSLERMLEPNPDERATSVGAALDARSGVAKDAPRAPRDARVSAVTTAPTNEDAIIKSVRRLLWTLWGLGWVIVPILLSVLNAEKRLVPLIMFGTLAALLVVTWHKGALLRMGLRYFREAGGTTSAASLRSPSPRRRVEIVPSEPEVRIRTADLTPEELVSDTEVEVREKRAARR